MVDVFVYSNAPCKHTRKEKTLVSRNLLLSLSLSLAISLSLSLCTPVLWVTFSVEQQEHPGHPQGDSHCVVSS